MNKLAADQHPGILEEQISSSQLSHISYRVDMHVHTEPHTSVKD